MTPPGGGAVRAGVIDIGSNSVRLVVYDVSGAGALAHFNEKVMAGLGRGVRETGRLSTDGVEMAMGALIRFRAVLDGLGVSQAAGVATAAVRDADDGADFAARAAETLGVPVRVLSGDDEARLSALGVLTGSATATGIAGDLGGSSLEVSEIGDGRIGRTETHLLGPLIMTPDVRFDEKSIRREVRKALKGSSVVRGQGGSFHLVGGAWRSLAKLHMELTEYPLRLLHGYRMSPKAVRSAAKAALATDTVSRARRDSVAGRRSATLPYAAVLLEEMCEAGRFSEAILSAHGLREGVLFDLVGRSRDDPLLAGIALSARLGPGQRRFGDALYSFVSPAIEPEPNLFGLGTERARIDQAACLLADSGARLHPDHRAQLAYQLALRGAYAGADHAERAFIALAVAARYSRRFRAPSDMTPLLSPESELAARQLGACMRLGAVLSGRSADVLASSSLQTADGALTLVVSKSREGMISEAVSRRLNQAADILGLKPELQLV
ncbi:MAG: Ppx/GppA phosphatase family protein [Pseudomonadota bacterium]